MTMTFLNARLMTLKHLLALLAAIVFVLSPSIASAQDTVVYFHTDAIGSVRMITDASGAEIERYDFLPFGEPWAVPTTQDVRQFAGKERDAESGGLDYFGARYYRGASGRFISVDPLMDVDAALGDPQTWNRYSYGRSNPFRYIDPNGAEITTPASFQQPAFTQEIGAHLTSFGKAIFNTFQSINLPGHNLTPAATEKHFAQPASEAESNQMQFFDLAITAAGLLAGVREPSYGISLAEDVGILRSAAQGRGNFSLGSASASDAARLGRAWVGEGYSVASDGKTMISHDGLRQYRPPSWKKDWNEFQANFEQRPVNKGAWGSNGHLSIKDLFF
jgi:RHS repeat-associated protein